MTRLYVLRHGETDWNVEGRLQGAADVPLNDNGRAQARSAVPMLGAALRPGFVWVTSPLQRARETVAIISAELGGDVEVDDRLAERAYGVWEGLTATERERDFPEEHARWKARHEQQIEGYEVHVAVAGRMREAFAHWTARVPGDVVFVTHGSSGRMLMLDLLGLPSAGHAISNLGNAAWSRLVPSVEGRWSLDRHNIGAA